MLKSTVQEEFLPPARSVLQLGFLKITGISADAIRLGLVLGLES